MAGRRSNGKAMRDAPDDGDLIKLAILAVGGQGGGVLSDWIVHAAEQSGYTVQATSVPGVAQRTGATIYSIEMLPRSDRAPVLALMPAPGDVDIVIAAELMEAGRAITRGLVTPDRTTLIASSHRILAVSEKIEPGHGLADSDGVIKAAREVARTLICFDMEQTARACGSVVSASLFGALAGSGVLPFKQSAYESAIEASGRGVEASLEAFRRARAQAQGGAPSSGPEMEAPSVDAVPVPSGPARQTGQWQKLTDRVMKAPPPVREMAMRGLAKVVDFQDLQYGEEYLDRLEQVLEADRKAASGDGAFALTTQAAKHIANAMAYDDVIRVADRKTRLDRFRRIHGELGRTDGQIVHLTEFMHPRGEEVCGMLPARLGCFIEARPRVYAALDRLVNRGRRPRSDTVFGFAMLSALAGMRRWRRGLLRHQREQAHVRDWLDQALAMAATDYRLGVEMIRCRRLIKGYSDTHARGMSKFDRVLAAAPLLAGRDDAAVWLARLREAALKDEEGTQLDGAIETVRSFAGDAPAEGAPAGTPPEPRPR